MQNKLYLHMGPGYHAQVEKALHQKYQDKVDFWNQPPVSSFAELVDATYKKVKSMRSAAGPVTLIGHSFGGQLAHAVAKHMMSDQLIEKIVFINCAFSPFECFLRMAKKLDSTFSADEENSLRNSPTPTKIDFIVKTSMTPGFNELYWQSKEKMMEMLPLITKYPGTDPGVFVGVFSRFLNKLNSGKIHSSESCFLGQVEIYHSAADLLVDQSDSEGWKKYYPQAKIHTFERGGHNILLEVPEMADIIFS